MALEHELFSIRESLQTVVQELETTNQELQAANEELLTLNDEPQEKTRQCERLANQPQTIQDSIDSPLPVVDRELRVTRCVPRIDELVPLERIRPQDHLTALPCPGTVRSPACASGSAASPTTCTALCRPSASTQPGSRSR
jgi:two-component system CheB/CheR fusion protein